jgi:hypothetical protein
MTGTTPPNLQAEYIHRVAWKAGVLGALNLATAVLAVRVILLLAVVGAAVLAVLTLRTGQPAALAVLGIYTVSVVCPLVWLSSRH